ncbi:phosphatidylserine/phosphatidylglycerophosphate/ cardiolipin synthase [Candidatus Portiera aleyrodidarum]|uniref:Cardiolipin synthase n=1 Tax=Candidatus Portiera aleyrodidarum TaxID=91844 RepID=A0A6S6RR14_9GAMM|nr:cardiolipin synthase [Candidatus Portiera aleyrodidarum]CAA3707173.1 phosphatidylserine/phosphatidylglycerophosphate/ cardiolipin synthase [Candidatus Portiera aleyrodidarum]
MNYIKTILNIILFLTLLFSILTALMISRTPQGAIAWLISLITFPYLSIPIFWILSCPNFCGYIRKTNSLHIKKLKHYLNITCYCNVKVVEKLAILPLTKSNGVKLLINGYITFKSMFDGIKRAKKYILLQFFIIKNDNLGQKFKKLLIYSAKKGVQIFFIYDKIGSRTLSSIFIKELKKAGIKFYYFGFCKGWKNILFLNYCNHRKLIIVDGKEAWIGGLNIGLEYLGRNKKIGYWRDTHLHIIGPSVLFLQEIFLEDWYWTTETKIKNLNWKPKPIISNKKNQHIIIVPSGPVYNLNNASLLIQNSINIAKQKFWITSPYFIPDQSVMDSLKLAALRGVDVKIIIPERTDHLLVYLSTFSYLSELIKFGVKIYKYIKGFLHQKVMLIDNHTASVGTINLDNRSFRLNFEITAYIIDYDFAKDVDYMLKQDLLYCKKMKLNEIKCRSLINKLLSKTAFLASPLQ